jgi:predicted CopG family antitoxin
MPAARKSVRLDMDAYRRLMSVKRADESYSQVIKRLFPARSKSDLRKPKSG